MSGFAGIIRLEPTLETAETDRIAIARMAEAIAFRGPDAQQQSSCDGASFAFSLLITGPAPQANVQPVTVDGETFFLGEARIDGRLQLIQKLRGHDIVVLPSASDEELVLHFAECFGTEALPQLDGDFSFALWKPRERKVFAFRDLGGARPFFYCQINGQLIFSNTLQALLAAGIVSLRDYDLQFIANFLLGSPHFDGNRTIYRDVRRLPAGHLLEFSLQHLSPRRIAEFPVEGSHFGLDGRLVVEEFSRLLKLAVSDRLPEADVSILLSGGLDSTSIAATIVSLRKQAAKKNAGLHALCVDFQPLFPDEESEYASHVAQVLGIELQVVHSGNVLPFAGWEDSVGELPEPLTDPYALLYLSYRQQASRGARVVFSGDGGDEVLRLQAAPYLRFLWNSRGAFASASVLLGWLARNRRLPPLGFGLRTGLLRAIGRTPAEEIFPPWFTPEFEKEHDLRNRWAEMSVPPPVSHPANPQAYHVLNSGRFAEAFELCDPVFTGVALETRSPFLDRRLCRFLLRLPVIPWALDKHLLRVSQQGILPDAILRRRKTPITQDPLVLQVAGGLWNPSPADPCVSGRFPFIDGRKLAEVLANSRDMSLYVHLRVLALTSWMKAVEKGPGSH